MKKTQKRIVFLLLIALLVTIIPLPAILDFLRPPCVLLVCLYLQLYAPSFFSVSLLVILGLVMDSLLSTVLGEHVFSLCLVAWLASSKGRRFSFFSMGQQMAFMGFFACIYQLSLVCIDCLLGNQGHISSVIGVSLVSIVLWPWMSLIGEEFLMSGVSYEI